MDHFILWSHFISHVHIPQCLRHSVSSLRCYQAIISPLPLAKMSAPVALMTSESIILAALLILQPSGQPSLINNVASSWNPHQQRGCPTHPLDLQHPTHNVLIFSSSSLHLSYSLSVLSWTLLPLVNILSPNYQMRNPTLHTTSCHSTLFQMLTTTIFSSLYDFQTLIFPFFSPLPPTYLHLFTA